MHARTISISGLALGLVLAGLGCQKPSQIDPTAVAQSLIDQEGQAWLAVKDKQADTFKGFFTEGGLVVSSWLTQDMVEKTAQINNPKFALMEYELSNMKVTFPAPNNAIVNYKATYKYSWDGQEFPTEVNSASVWVNRENKWLIVMHSESVVVND